MFIRPYILHTTPPFIEAHHYPAFVFLVFRSLERVKCKASPLLPRKRKRQNPGQSRGFELNGGLTTIFRLGF